jgi:hypothetical protein
MLGNLNYLWKFELLYPIEIKLFATECIFFVTFFVSNSIYGIFVYKKPNRFIIFYEAIHIRYCFSWIANKNNPKGNIQDCEQIGKYSSVCILPANERRSGTCLTAATWMLSGSRQLQKEPKKSHNT